MAKKKLKKNTIITDILDKITPEESKRARESVDAQIKWLDEHPDYQERYGTDESYWLETIKSKGFNPIGITVLMCEESFIMETEEEVDKAWEVFKPEGFWYTRKQFEIYQKELADDMYDGDVNNMAKVHWL